MPRCDGEAMSTDLRAVAHVVGVIRPDWDAQGIHAQLTAAAGTYSFADVAHAAIDAARTPSTRTPAGSGARLRGGWRTDAPVERPTPTPPPVGELWRQLPPEDQRVAGPSLEQRALIAQGLRRFDQ